MQVAKWGNSLAVRLPASTVKAVQLKAGDEVEIELAGDDALLVRRKLSRQAALQSLHELSKPLPHSFRFDREEANERPWVQRLEVELRRKALSELPALGTPLPEGFYFTRAQAYER